MSALYARIGVHRVRQIVAIQAEINVPRNTLSASLARLDAMETELQRLAKTRHRNPTRGVLSILRKAQPPVPIRVLTMPDRGLDTSDLGAVRRMREWLRLLLRNQEAAGIVVKTPDKEPERRQVWAIAE